MPQTFAHRTLLAALSCALIAVLALAGTALAARSGANASRSGGTAWVPPPPPPEEATIVDGKAIAPADAPRRIKRVIAAGNRLIGKPYRYGGGHRAYSRSRKLDRGYDCSGTVSYALYGGRFLRSPLPSGALMSWGRSGPGDWLTVYAHGGHTYLVVAGLRLDTGMRDDPSRTGPAWSKRLRKSAAYTARHPRGY